MMNSKKIFAPAITAFILTIYVGAFSPLALASSTNGTIDSTNRYAWTENAGWIDLGSSQGSVAITDSALTGYAWGENIGWISLNCSNDSSCGTVSYSVANNSEGTLTGYAWSENAGWIQFDPTGGGVTINSSGDFSGYAWGENIGWIVFNCTTTSSCGTVSYKVSTDWRPASSRSSGSTTPPPPPVQVPQSGGGVLPPVPPTQPQTAPPPPAPPQAPQPPPPVITQIPKILEPIIPGFLKPKPPAPPLMQAPPPLVSKEAPLALHGLWQLLPTQPIREFVLAPLPKGIRILAQKFPELQETFSKVGIKKITDVEKIRTARLALPTIKEIRGLPIASLPPAVKANLPTEVIFVKSGGERIDLGVSLGVTDKGTTEQKIRTLTRASLNLSVKPEQAVKSVKGFVVFKRKIPHSSLFQVPLPSLAASLIFANPVFAQPQTGPIATEEEFVFMQFEYTDPDGDGIYTADIDSPAVDGEYEIITVMNYENPELGAREIRLTTVVDPEGYVFEKIGNKEARIPDAIVSLYALNMQTNQSELWPAKNFQQENPQTTDVTGRYAFLVPEGTYSIRIETAGYLPYEGAAFEVKDGAGVHTNIELTSSSWWLKIFDWRTVGLIAIALLLLVNFWRDRMRKRNPA